MCGVVTWRVGGLTVDETNPRVPLRGPISVLRGSFKGSIGGLGFRVDDINPALPIIRSIPWFP